MPSLEEIDNFVHGLRQAIRSGNTRVLKLHKILGKQELYRPGGWVKNLRILDDVDSTVLADFHLPLERMPDGMRLEIGHEGDACPAGAACPTVPLLRIGQGERTVDVLDDCLADGELLDELVLAELELHSLTCRPGWQDLHRDYTWRGRLYADNKGLHCRLTVRLKAS